MSSGFSLREVRHLGLADLGAVAVKVYAINAPDLRLTSALTQAALRDAADVLGRVQGSSPDAGFVLVHVGEEAEWCVVCWWVSDMLHREVLRRELGSHTPFTPVQDPTLVACVWELHVIDWERRAWSQTALSAKGVPSYTAYNLAVLSVQAGESLALTGQTRGGVGGALPGSFGIGPDLKQPR